MASKTAGNAARKRATSKRIVKKRPSTRKSNQNKANLTTKSALRIAKGHKRTRDDHARELAEDYVELIDDLIMETGEARAVDIATRLGVTHVTVTNTIARLKRAGLVTSEPYRAVFLTEKGKRIATESRNRHELVLEFLLAVGVPPEDAEIDAEGIEHHLSPNTLNAIKKFLNAK
jgi:DtxR family manganese transport transcriptional regulator